jgi:hypothetical protein
MIRGGDRDRREGEECSDKEAVEDYRQAGESAKCAGRRETKGAEQGSMSMIEG